MAMTDNNTTEAGESTGLVDASKTGTATLVGAHSEGPNGLTRPIDDGSGDGFVPVSSRAERTTSFSSNDFPLPSGREEEWRFTPVRELAPVMEGTSSGGSIEWETSLPEGVSMDTITLDEARELGIGAPADRPAALAAELADTVNRVVIDKDAAPDAPVVVRLTGTGDDKPAFGHLLIQSGAHAKVTVIVAHAGSAAYSELVSVVAGDGSELTVVTVQEWEDDAIHASQQDVLVGRDATVRHIAVTLGGRLVRVNTNAAYSGPGGSFEGLGVYFADSGQHQEHRLFVDHEAPNCHSNVEYKGALQGEKAHTVWVGDVLIQAAATGTDTYELNRNLLLTDGARADSVPNLEIETGEIEGAGHASATGRFDDEQLFYLQSRGVPEDAARRLVVRGFFAAIIQRIGVPQVVEHLMEMIERELEGDVSDVVNRVASEGDEVADA